MVRSFAVRTAALALVVALSAALPLNASAQDATAGAPTQYHYSTTVTQVYGSRYPIAGHLDLEVFPTGIVRGYYHNAFQKAFIQVVGGRDGNYIWFDIGPTLTDLGFGVSLPPGGRFHVVATMNPDNAFRGQLYEEVANVGTPQIGAPLNPGAYGRPPGSLPAPNSQYAALVSANSAGPDEADQLIFAATPTEKSAEDYQGAY